jgi:beta-galactosidase
VCYFRWRQAPFAQEQMHAGLLRPDSVAAPAHDEAAQVARELVGMPEVSTARADVALVFDYASDWAWATQPQGRGFSYFWLAFHFYKGLRRLGLSVDILPPDVADLSAYKLVLAPGVATLSAPLMAALASHGGTAILGPRTNAKTPDFATPVPLPPNLPGLDIRVARVESLPPDVPVPLAGGGNFTLWREKLEGTAEVTEASMDGWPAVVQAGKLHYLAGWPDEVALDRLLAAATRAEGISTDMLPEGLRCRDTEHYRFWFNYNAVPVEWGGITIPPAGVHWHAI